MPYQDGYLSLVKGHHTPNPSSTPPLKKRAHKGFASRLNYAENGALHLRSHRSNHLQSPPTPTLHSEPLSSPMENLSPSQAALDRSHQFRVALLHQFLRSTTSEETSSGPTLYVEEEPEIVTVEDVQPVAKNSYAEIVQKDEVKEDSTVDGQAQAFEFLENLDIKLDSEDTYSILLFGSGALIALWLATAVVGAIDSIPLFPKLMEVVGLSYTLWFSTRYLIFKENRQELFAKIDEIKQQVLGVNDD
ncbi:protein CURVATURE THYLAKOID 1D, chloroplastic-like [Actinidia eriantha]|uniref:protein CURVATURE THYLAKOID 1D, chloroplastic-like n=1 Tax=Actinidia eriantha TaxID=165200 RepID=UPI002589E6F3|nr:protein CURVATURE THYLAKOID 1D, chloroplastic-like [Actinidia eriantha]